MSRRTTGSDYFSLSLNSHMIFLLNCPHVSVFVCVNVRVRVWVCRHKWLFKRAVSLAVWRRLANRAFCLTWSSSCVQTRSQPQFNKCERVCTSTLYVGGEAVENIPLQYITIICFQCVPYGDCLAAASRGEEKLLLTLLLFISASLSTSVSI